MHAFTAQDIFRDLLRALLSAVLDAWQAWCRWGEESSTNEAPAHEGEWPVDRVGLWWTTTFHAVHPVHQPSTIALVILGEAVELALAAGVEPRFLAEVFDLEVAKAEDRGAPVDQRAALAEELADVQVGIRALAYALGVDLEDEVTAKMNINLGRDWRPDGTRNR